MKKRILALLMTAILLMTALPALAEEATAPDRVELPVEEGTELQLGMEAASAPAETVIAEAAANTATVKNKSKIKLNKGDSVQLVVDGKTITGCSSSDKKVASVTKAGLVTAKKEGSAKITVKLGKKKIAVTAKVSDPNKPTGISLDQKGTVILAKGNTMTLTATLKPATAVGKVKWSSSDKKVAAVSGGVVTGKKKGTATITAKVGKKSAKVKVKVVAAKTDTGASIPSVLTKQGYVQFSDPSSGDELTIKSNGAFTLRSYTSEGAKSIVTAKYSGTIDAVSLVRENVYQLHIGTLKRVSGDSTWLDSAFAAGSTLELVLRKAGVGAFNGRILATVTQNYEGEEAKYDENCFYLGCVESGEMVYYPLDPMN